MTPSAEPLLAKTASEPQPPAARSRRRRDLFGVAWIVLFALLFVAPALKDGPSFAPADLGTILSTFTAGAIPLQTDCAPVPSAPAPPTCTHDNENGDQIDQMIPWSNEDWTLIHHGELPWWSSDEATGLPLFLNFGAASFSLPSLVSYLFPLSWVFLVIVLMKLVICGLGAYLLARLLGCRPIASAFGGTTAMLSGSFAGWLGWSQTGTFCWAGFIAAGLLWSYRSPRRTLPLVVLAGSIAFAIYGGFPEGYALLAFFFIVLFAVPGLVALARRALDWHGLARVGLGVVLGLFLAAPLWLPGLSVLRQSVHRGEDTARGLSLHGLALLFAQGYDGLPIAGSNFFSSSLPNYFETATYVGVLAIVLSGVALVVGRRRLAVVGLGAGVLGCLLLSYRIGAGSGIVQNLVADVGLGTINVSRLLVVLGLAVAMLGAIGLEIVIARFAEVVVGRVLWTMLGLVAFVLVGLGAFALSGLSPAELALRRASLEWPVASIVLFALVLALVGDRRIHRSGPLARFGPGRLLGGVTLVGQSAFLLFAGVGINSYARVEFPTTPATSQLAAHVGDQLVALDAGNSCPSPIPGKVCGVKEWLGTGFYPNMNLGYGIDELAVHDPTAPAALFASWPIAADGALAGELNLFAPNVNTAALARQYGARFILVAKGLPVPSGTVQVATIDGDVLVSVPGSARFSSSGGSITAVSHPGDASYRLTLDPSDHASVITARVTDSPGWQASADGTALRIRRTGGVFMSVSVPSGARSVIFTYRLPRLTIAVCLLIVGLVALLGDAMIGVMRWRKQYATPAIEQA